MRLSPLQNLPFATALTNFTSFAAERTVVQKQDWYEAEADVAANKGSETNERKSFSKGA